MNIRIVKSIFPGVAVLCLLGASSNSAAICDNLLDFEPQKLRSDETINFCERFSGKTLLVVNTASRCGFTPQFKELESLYQKYKDQGLVVIGFPSNDFKQELADEEEVAEVCYINYGVTFPMVSESSVKGEQVNPLFKQLIAKTGESPAWNFNKYLVSADLKTVTHYDSSVTPMASELESDLAALLR